MQIPREDAHAALPLSIFFLPIRNHTTM